MTKPILHIPQKDSPGTTLVISVNTMDTILTVVDSSIFSNANITRLTLGRNNPVTETVQVVRYDPGNEIVVIRGSSPLSWSAGTNISRVFTAADLKELQDYVIDLNVDTLAMAQDISDLGNNLVTNGDLHDHAGGDGAQITASGIANLAITEYKIADYAVTSDKIGPSAVITSKIYPAAVTEDKIAQGSITINKIGADAVNGSKIADDSINSEHYVDGSIDTAHIGDLQVTSDKLSSNAVIADKIASNAVTETKIYAGAVTADKIGADAVNGSKIANDSINSEHYVDGSIDTAHIGNLQVTPSKTSFFTNTRILEGRINSSWEFLKNPGSWTTTNLGTGAVRINHNLGTAKYAFYPSADTRFAIWSNKGNNSIDVHIFGELNGAMQHYDAALDFLLIVD